MAWLAVFLCQQHATQFPPQTSNHGKKKWCIVEERFERGAFLDQKSQTTMRFESWGSSFLAPYSEVQLVGG